MSTLRLSVAKSAAWSAVRIGGNQVTSFVVFVVLSRIISPGEIGVVALAASFIDVAGPLMRGGLPEALIQREEDGELYADTCFWSTFAASLVMLALLLLGAPIIARSFNAPTFAPVLRVLALTLPIYALAATHEARLTREFGFKALAVRGISSNLLGGVAGVVMAWLGCGVWSLVAQRMIAAIAGVMITWSAYPWVPRLRLSLPALRHMASFGMHMTATSFLNLTNSRLAEFILAYHLGPSAVAFMRVASRCLDLVTQLTTAPLTSVALATFSRLQGDRAALERAFTRMTQVCSFMTFPAYFGLAIVAKDLVPLVFGEQWQLSGQVLPILCLVAVPVTLQFFTWPALAAVGRSDQAALGTLVIVVLSAALTAVLGPFGVLAVAGGNVARSYVTLPMSLWLLRRFTSIRPRYLLRVIRLPLLAAGIMAAVTFVGTHLLRELDPMVRTSLSVAMGSGVYVGLLLIFGRSHVNDLRDLLRRRA